MNRYTNRSDMRYRSPDGIRPNQELLERARKNFNKTFPKQTTPVKPPSPSQLPMPSKKLLNKNKSRSKSPSPIVIQGKNRKWTIKAKKSSRPRTSSATRRRGKGTLKYKIRKNKKR